MDPNACLQRIADSIRSGDTAEAWRAMDDYREWIRRGGEPGALVVAGDELKVFAFALRYRSAGKAKDTYREPWDNR